MSSFFSPVLTICSPTCWLAGIAPASLCREKATHHLAQHAVLDENLALNQLVTEAQPGECQRLKSHHATVLQESNFSILEAWRSNWDKALKT